MEIKQELQPKKRFYIIVKDVIADEISYYKIIAENVDEAQEKTEEQLLQIGIQIMILDEQLFRILCTTLSVIEDEDIPEISY